MGGELAAIHKQECVKDLVMLGTLLSPVPCPAHPSASVSPLKPSKPTHLCACHLSWAHTPFLGSSHNSLCCSTPSGCTGCGWGQISHRPECTALTSSSFRLPSPQPARLAPPEGPHPHQPQGLIFVMAPVSSLSYHLLSSLILQMCVPPD